jgi:site-specific recombinase XerD
MNDLITSLKSLETETIKNLRNSKSANTLRAYQSDYNDFSIFCSKNGFTAMPTQPKILALYITYLSSFSKYSTLKRRLASISILHKTKGHYIDTKHPVIMENLMGIKRIKGSNQKGKKPILSVRFKIIN